MTTDELQKLKDLREKIYDLDVPSPTIPEYVELHELATIALNSIDKLINDAEKILCGADAQVIPTDIFERAGFTKEQSSGLHIISRKFGVAPHYLIAALRDFAQQPMCSSTALVGVDSIEIMREHLGHLQLGPGCYEDLIPATKLAIKCMEVVCNGKI